MATTAYQSRALLTKRGQSVDEILVWKNAACQGLDFKDLLPELQPKPVWATPRERARLSTETVVIQRFELPPAVYFCRGAELEVTSVYLASLLDLKLRRGEWVTPETFLETADEQWQAVIFSLVSQLRHALAVGYVKLPVAQSDSAAAAPRTPQQNISTGLRDLSTRPIASPESTASPRQAELENSARTKYHDSSIVTCSGYPEGSGSEEGSIGDEDDDGSDGHNQIQVQVGPGAVHWHPGEVANIRSGGADVQRILDADGVRLGIIHWHAAWIESCLETAPFLQRLALRFPSAAVMHLDVEASMASKLLAYEKVLTKAESRRRGAKPVLKDGASFPCLTVHEPCNLLPLQMYCGQSALDELAQFLAPQAPELRTAPSVAPAEKEAPSLGPEPAIHPPDRVTASGAPHSLDLPDRQQDFTAPAERLSKGTATAGQLLTLHRGAMEFKQILSKASQEGLGVLVLWISGQASGNHSNSFRAQAGTAPGQILLEADVTKGKDNRQLAGPLGVKAFPTIQGYFKMKLVKSLDTRAPSWRSTGQAVSTVLEALAAVTAPGPKPAGSASPEQILREVNGSKARESSLTEGSSAEALEPSSATSGSRDATFDPPPNAKTGTKKQLAKKGPATFWPKMPCLRCGCPWWLGEDWDARCARCDWSAEQDGYDDDSKPLPKFRAKHAAFTACLRDGRTAEYQP